jgi:hypothetical protein
MEELKKLLDLSKLKSSNVIEDCFRKVAKELFQNYHIEKGENCFYDFVEIEFYYYSEGHQDVITYARTANAGDWFFHNSGVDIAFKSVNDKECYGGILIRGIKKGDAVIAGPLNCVDELFDKFTALEIPKDFPIITLKENKTNEEPKCCKRWIKSKSQNLNKFIDAYYCYYINVDPSMYTKKYEANPAKREQKE